MTVTSKKKKIHYNIYANRIRDGDTMEKRKNIRLPNFDYTVGTYFVTVCSKNKENIFVKAVGAAISRPWELTNCGKIVEKAIKAIAAHYPNITLGHYVVMPNHIHILLTLHETGHGRLIAAPTLSTVIGQMKRRCSKEIGRPIWQKSFYDHGVRNREDYLRIWQYIDENPAKWDEDKYHTL